jgi:hypothetical protein
MRRLIRLGFCLFSYVLIDLALPSQMPNQYDQEAFDCGLNVPIF